MAMLVLTAITVLVAAASALWARQSARAARDTVAPLQRLGASMQRAAELEEASVQEQGALLTALTEANRTAQRVADEQRLERDLERLRQMVHALWDMIEGLRRREQSMPAFMLHEAHARVGAALVAFPADQLPKDARRRTLSVVEQCRSLYGPDRRGGHGAGPRLR